MPERTGPAPGPPAVEPRATWRVHLPRTTAAVPMARALIRTALGEIDPEGPGAADGRGGPDRSGRPDRDTAELLTAELVANAVEHTSGEGAIELVVELFAAPGGCQIEVHDPDPARPGQLVCPDPDAEVDPWQEHGRGLLLIRALSSDCGHRPTAHGKAVWFTLPRLPAPRRPPRA
ncbi:ATP-binding protein [Streptomyces sp. NE5-10]|uniref:ATP-binding protein n=1 Tax=Streptomyces sp. NE5-10 TaxID=2759674 RepID=UPI00190712CC|nr:ATP-binding protein [Streptomyces sp. NE5-10]GHJ96617.1 ATP-binding protein [Streptomyces sp. NE5-10]